MNFDLCMTKIQVNIFITDEGIDEESFYVLDGEDILKLMPKVGPRAKFKTKMKLLKVILWTVKILYTNTVFSLINLTYVVTCIYKLEEHEQVLKTSIDKYSKYYNTV